MPGPAAIARDSVPDVPALFPQLRDVNNEVKGLSLLDFPAIRVFVTFETKAAQRNVLRSLTVRSKTVRKSKAFEMDNSDYLFRSGLVLNVKEPEEPSTIRWQDLSHREWDRVVKLVLTAYTRGPVP